MKKIFLFFAILTLIAACKPNNPKPPNNPPGVTRINYGNHPLQNFDLYLPQNSNQNTKVVIMVHGGGWVVGYHPNAEVTTFSGRYGWNIASPLLDAGYALAVMKYRTVCYNTVPSKFKNNTSFYLNQMKADIDSVIDYLKQNSAALKISNNHFQLIGESGGGHIVMAYGIDANADSGLKSVVSMFGPSNLDATDFKQAIAAVPTLAIKPPNYILQRSDNCKSVTNRAINTLFSLKSFSDHNNISINQSNPFLAEISTTRPSKIQNNVALFITHGADDLLVPKTQATAMRNAMQSKFASPQCNANDYSCQLKLKIYPNCGHGWIGSNCNKNQVMANIVTWIKKH